MRMIRRLGSIKGWRHFGFEVAIIVIGVGIALIANQWVSTLNRAGENRQAMQAVEADLMSLFIFSSERLMLEPCRREQVEDLARKLERSDGGWAPGALADDSDPVQVLPSVIRTPTRPWPTIAWDTLTASDASLYLDRDKFHALSAIFHTAEQSGTLQVDAWRMKGRLADLGIGGAMDATRRRDAYSQLGELASVEGLLYQNARLMRDLIMQLDFEFEGRLGKPTDMTDDDLRELLDQRQEIYGTCMDIAEFQPFIDHYNALFGREFVFEAEGEKE